MNAEAFFKDMFHHIWQSHDITRLDDYYAKNFEETIATWDEQQKPIEHHLGYDYIVEQSISHQENFRDTTIDIKKAIAGENGHISVMFYASAIERKTNKTQSRYVSGIWRLNSDNKIDRVWAVVTPFYSGKCESFK